MKKRFLIAALVAPALLTSCLGDPKDTTTKTILPIYNHVTPTDGSSETTVGKGEYTFNQNVTQGTLEMLASSLKLGEQTGSFTTPTEKYGVGSTYEIVFKSATAGLFNNDEAMPVTNLQCAIYSVYNYLDNRLASTLPKDLAVPSQYYALPIMSYKVGSEYNVKTFYAYPYFKGTTVTTDDTNKKFENKKMGYFISMDVAKKKANVVLTDAKFSEKMPMELAALILRDLDIKFTPAGYQVTGSGIIPAMMQGSQEVPVASFVFDTFQLTTTSSDMTQAVAIYDVLNKMGETEKRYKGEFSGKYTYVAENTGKPN